MKLLVLAAIPFLISAAMHRGSASLRVSKLVSKAPDEPFGPLEEKKFQFPWPHMIDDERCPTGHWRVGCVQDSGTQKHWYHKSIPSEDRVAMTIKVCANWCKTIKGTQFFGVENGDSCYCAPWFHNTNSGGNGKCDMPCVGDNSEICGGQYLTDIYQMHDCNNLPAVPCTQPPAMVPFAKMFKSRYYRGETPCKNTATKPLTTVEFSCQVECLPGYELHANTIRCNEKGNRLTFSWGQVEGAASCTPVSCGSPPDKVRTRHLNAEVVFPNKAEYNCQLGYTLDQKAVGLKKFDTNCQTDATFSPLSDCKPVICGMCPTGEKYPHANPAEKMERTYGMPCNYQCDTGYTLDQQAGGEKTFKIVCLATGEFEEPNTCRPVTCGPPPKIPDADLFGVNDKDDPIVFPNKAEYKCDKGYTLDAKAKGVAAFNLNCLASGTFSKKPECLPVLCGMPPEVKNSAYLKEVLVFKQSVTYTCEIGYSLNGKADGKKSTTLHCGFDAKFEEKTPQCKPIECGKPPEVKHGTTEVKGVVTYASPAIGYVCNDGYSVLADDDPYDLKMTKFAVACQADGKFQKPETCKNIDDCLFHNCGPHGSCKDIKKPTAKPFDNYECKCDKGFEQTLIDSTSRDEKAKICTNINDCPVPLDENCGGRNAKGMQRGKCTDLLMDYACSCRSGYEVKEKGKNATCVPIKCGSVPEVEFAKSDLEGKADYDTPEWKFKCDKGYTLNGEASGEKEFPMNCQNDGNFKNPAVCLPVTCGAPLPLDFADMTPKVDTLFFPKKVTYVCEEGYSVNSKADGPVDFEVSCQANGRKTSMKKCSPVECGKIPKHDNAKYDKSKVAVYQDEDTIECEEGYSIDQTTNVASFSYPLTCQSDGKFSEEKECKNIKCGSAPPVENSEVSDAVVVFKDKAKYTLDDGYSLNGKAGGPTTFEIECLSDGQFTEPKEIKPVSCGASPSFDHSTHTKKAKWVFKEELSYTCVTGYSVNGKADGTKDFKLKCAADGKFTSDAKGCKPVECGSVVMELNSEQVSDPDGKSLSKLHFNQKAYFKCKKGYSLDGALRGPVKFTTRCMADGEITPHDGCKNINDCEGNQCGENGRCVDHAEPTGEHKDDYHCDCDSGFEEEVLDDGTRICANVPDCPEGACLPGSCQDLVNDYECNCPEGYFEGPNPEEELEHDCLPVKCGKPPNKNHAKTEQKNTVQYFAMDPIEYKCDTGYTLDGAPDGDTDFELTCKADKSFSDHPGCTPVVCGLATEVANAKYPDDKEFTFGDKVLYTCEEGYAKDPKKPGSNTFRATCEADASFSGVEECLPVVCPQLKEQKNANFAWDSDAQPQYGDEITVNCLQGFALDKDKHDKNSYVVKCKANGKLGGLGESCKPIDCGDKPSVDDGKAKGSTRFGQVITVTADKGYSIDGTAEGAKTFETRCKKDGSFSALKKFQRVSCGPPAKIPNAEPPEIEGDFFFLQELGSTGKHKTILGDVRKVAKSHNVSMSAETESRNKARAIAQKMKLARSALHDSKSTQESSADENRIHQGVNGTIRQRRGKNRRDSSALYGDKIEYKCKEGYAVDENGDGIVDADEEDDIEMQCLANGEIKSADKHGKTECLPVNCKLPSEGSPAGSEEDPPSENEVDKKVKSYPMINPEVPSVPLTFKMKQAFSCAAGYSLDGKPRGANEFEETCQASGKLTSEHECKDIDWCTLSKCGENGKCVDGALGYTCDCDDGYKVELTDEGFEECVQIDECDTQGGEEACTANGKCIDKTLKYKCECEDGYMNEEVDEKDTCTPVICGDAPEVDHATTPMKGIKISYPDSAPYACEVGYSLDGTVESPITFEIKCNADESFSGEKECEPIKCGKVEAVENSKKNASDLKFPEVVGYTCDKGHTTSGQAGGITKFSSVCTADGFITDALTCKPVRCGKPVEVLFARFPLQSVLFPGKVKYICQEGFTIDAKPGGDPEFETECQEDGKFTKAEACMPISCGLTKQIDHAIMPVKEFTYGNQFQVTCESGYTVDKDPDGEGTFMVKCGKDGEYEGMKECKPITCGKAKESDAATCGACDPADFMGTTEFKCKEGYTVDGMPKGRTKFEKMCQADGAYGDSAPSDCIDINFCHGNPCGKNGVCIDDGPGKPAPGYTCECNEGFEVKEGPKGQVCGADDCAGDPCGDGGTCFDLSKKEPPGPKGAYTCECEDGFDLIEPEKDKYTCKRKECGPVKRLDNLEMDANDEPVIMIETWKGEDSDIDPMTTLPILKSFDSVEYTCKEGYSTDGGSGPESKSFVIQCTSSGILSRPLNPTKECQPVRCDNFMLPTVPFTTVQNAKESMFEFGDEVIFNCITGYSLNKAIDGPKSFKLPCQSNGKFPTDHENCKPISCGVPKPAENALRSTSKEVSFGESVTYTCFDGYTLDGKARGPALFGGACQADGKISISSEMGGVMQPICMPISCGIPPTIKNSIIVPVEAMFEEFGDFMLMAKRKHSKDNQTQKAHLPKTTLLTASKHMKQGQNWRKTSVTVSSVPRRSTLPNAHHYFDDDQKTSRKEHNKIRHSPLVDNQYILPAISKSNRSKLNQTLNQNSNQILNQTLEKGVMLHHSTLSRQKHSTTVTHHSKQPGEFGDFEGGDEMGEEAFEVFYGDPDVMLECLPGHSVGGIPGGQTLFSMRCKSNGFFTNRDKECLEPKFSVSGKATDAQSASIVLREASISFEVDGKGVGSAYTDSSGMFSLHLSAGTFTMKVSKAGYITLEKEVVVSRSIRVGQGADAALSKVLPPGAWRVVVEWDAKSRDIDSHTYFGPGEGTHVYWPSRHRSHVAPSTGGIEVDLDRDDVNGFGPETTTFKNLGKCTQKGNCLVKFKIKNYSYRNKPLGESGVKITLYNGDKVHSKYTIDESASSARNYYHPIFTIDAMKDNVKVHPGNYVLPPYITTAKIGHQNWWGSLDFSTWSRVALNGILYGLYTTGGPWLYNIEVGAYYKMQNVQRTTCKGQNWWGSFDRAGWSTCDAGWYLAGFYRTGHMWDWNHGTYQLEEGWCCKPDGVPGWGTCNEQSILQTSGWTQCHAINGEPTAIVGLYRSNDGTIRGIDKAKCCTLR